MFGILITARCGSTRLTKKHLRKIDGKFVLSYLIDRVLSEFKLELEENTCEICIVSGNQKDNNELSLFEEEKFLKVFFGSDQNIPLRHYQCASTNNYSHIISLDGDDILSSIIGMRAVHTRLKGGYDYCHTEGLPFGMNVTGYSTDFLGKCLVGNYEKILENGWGRIFPDENRNIIHYESNPKPFRLSLDYPADLEFFTELFKLTRDYKKDDYKEFIETIVDNNLMSINGHLIEDYWQAFREKEKLEILNEHKK